MAPFVDPKTHKLFFASDGHIGLGGLDIFEIDLFDPVREVQNLGAPFNTYRDDFYFVLGIMN